MVAIGWKFPSNVTNIQEENIKTRETLLRVTRTENSQWHGNHQYKLKSCQYNLYYVNTEDILT